MPETISVAHAGAIRMPIPPSLFNETRAKQFAIDTVREHLEAVIELCPHRLKDPAFVGEMASELALGAIAIYTGAMQDEGN